MKNSYMKNKITENRNGFISLIVVVTMSSYLLFSMYLTQYYIWNLTYAQARFETVINERVEAKNCKNLNSLYSSFDSNFNLINC